MIMAFSSPPGNGALMGAKKINLIAGINSTILNTSGLAQGLHIIKIAGSNKPLNLKLLVQ